MDRDAKRKSNPDKGSLTQEIELTHGHSQHVQMSTKTAERNQGLLLSQSDQKVIEDDTDVDIDDSGSSEKVIKSPDDNNEPVASTSTCDTSEQTHIKDTDLGRKYRYDELVTPTTIEECHLASERCRKAGARIREAIDIGNKLLGMIGEAIEIIENEVHVLLGVSGDKNFVNSNRELADQCYESIKILKRKAKQVKWGCSTGEGLAVHCEKNTIDALAFDFDPEEANYIAKDSESTANIACNIIFTREFYALRKMRQIWTDFSNSFTTVHEETGNFREQDLRCKARTRKTRIFNFVLLLMTIVLFTVAFSLFDTDSANFIFLLCPGIFVFGWSLLYWFRQIYNRIKSPCRTSLFAETGQSPPRYLDYIEKRLNELEEYRILQGETEPAALSSSTESIETEMRKILED